MPARKRKRRRYRKSKRSYKVLSYIKYLSIILLIIAILGSYLYVYRSGKWSSDQTFTVGVLNKDNNVDVYIFDPVKSLLVILTIPGTTQVDVARNYGKIKLRNVWRLSKGEGLEGKLLQETLTRYFYFPTDAYVKFDTNNYLHAGGVINNLRILSGDYYTNLAVIDKMKITYFLLTVSNIDTIEYDLEETGLLKRVQLRDGTVGYEYVNKPTQQISSFFHNQIIADQNPRIKVSNHTGEFGFVEEVSAIIEVLGSKVSFFENEEEKDVDCVLKYRNQVAAKVFNKYFECRMEELGEESNYDIEFVFGRKYWERY